VRLFDVGLTDLQICDICRFGLDGLHADAQRSATTAPAADGLDLH